jgi:hypothetical protein
MGTLQMLLIAWGVVTAMLVCAVIYRGTLETREEDRLSLDAAGDMMAGEQHAIVARIEMLSVPIVVLWVLSGGLLAVIAGMWLYQGYSSF